MKRELSGSITSKASFDWSTKRAEEPQRLGGLPAFVPQFTFFQGVVDGLAEARQPCP